MRGRQTLALIAGVAAALAGALCGCKAVVSTMSPVADKVSPGAEASAVAKGTATVLDARTLDVAGRRFQFYGIDAPDPDQTCETNAHKEYPCGIEARDRLIALIGGGPVTCVPHGANSYDTVLAVCSAGRADLAQALIDSGWAIADRGRSLYYEESELKTRAKKEGLWQGPFVTPQEWRDGERVPASRSQNESAKGLF